MAKERVWNKPFEGCYKITKGENKGKFIDVGFHDTSDEDDERFRKILVSLKLVK